MNNDLISRKWLTDAIRNRRTYLSYEDAKDVIDLIDNAPTVDTTCPHCDSGYAQGYSDGYLSGKEESPQGEWVPVSERLPEYTGLYLISIYDLVTVANFTGKHFCDRQMDNFVDVIAWQPLPEPYKKGGAE